MRIIAILLNIVYIGFLGHELATGGLPSGGDVWIAFLVVVLPFSNLIALFTSHDGKSWLALYLKRKALEEQRRIDELKKDHTV